MQGWLATVCAKQAYFHAVAQHRQGLVAQANKNFGETVARTKVSLAEGVEGGRVWREWWGRESVEGGSGEREGVERG